jgi:hypothetical protein
LDGSVPTRLQHPANSSHLDELVALTGRGRSDNRRIFAFMDLN